MIHIRFTRGGKQWFIVNMEFTVIEMIYYTDHEIWVNKKYVL